MRFTKHLTAVACAVAFFAGSATAETCDETGAAYEARTENSIVGNMLTMPVMRLIVRTPEERKASEPEKWSPFRRDEALTANPDCVKNIATGAYVSRQKYAAADGFFGRHLIIGWGTDILKKNPDGVGRTTIVGVTESGSEVTLHCNEKFPCTFGSLNKHALAWGLPFMVPKELFDKLKLDVKTKGTWTAVAALLWSPEYGELDANAKSARTKFLNNPTGYVDARISFASAMLESNNSQITVESSGEGTFIAIEATGENGSIVIGDATTLSGTQNADEETASGEATENETETLPACTSGTQTGCTHGPNHVP